MKTAKTLALLWVGLLAYLPPASGTPAPLSSQAIFKKWAGAVVTVETATKTGTGFFSSFGFLYTAFHVLDGAHSATITFPSGQTARITGAVVADKAKDYALLIADLKIAGPKLGDYAALQPGERVAVIGSPRGLAQTVTEGIVSAKRQDGDRQLLQLPAGISPGSSGSPVFNTQGEIVGLVVEKMEGESLNFAVSSADLKGLGGVPLSLAFAAPAPTGAPGPPPGTQTAAAASEPGSALCRDDDPRFRDLVIHSAVGYVGLKGVGLIVEKVPDALSGVISADDLRQWVSDALANGGINVMAADDHRAALATGSASQSDINELRWADGFYSSIDVSLNAVRMEDGSVSISYALDVGRAGIIMPGWMDMVRVDNLGAVQCLGAARNMKEHIRQEVAELAAQIVSRYQYANRPSDTSEKSNGG